MDENWTQNQSQKQKEKEEERKKYNNRTQNDRSIYMKRNEMNQISSKPNRTEQNSKHSPDTTQLY